MPNPLTRNNTLVRADTDLAIQADSVLLFPLRYWTADCAESSSRWISPESGPFEQTRVYILDRPILAAEYPCWIRGCEECRFGLESVRLLAKWLLLVTLWKSHSHSSVFMTRLRQNWGSGSLRRDRTYHHDTLVTKA